MSGIISSGGDESDREELLAKDTETVDHHGCEVSVNTTCQSRNAVSEPDGVDDHQENEEKYALYLERWFVMVIYTLLSIVGTISVTVWGPIEDTASVAFNINRSQFALLANWGNVIYICFAFPVSWFVRAQGLRVSVLLAAGLMVLGSGIICIPVPNSMMIWLMHVGQILIAFSGAIQQGLVSLLSVTWFPAHERVTATAIMCAGTSIGLASLFLLAPGIVSNIIRPTTLSPTTPSGNETHQYWGDDMHKYVKEIRLLLYIEFGACVLMFLVILIRFPAKPPLPPSASATAEREDIKSGLLTLVKKKVFWIPCLAYAINLSGFYGWTSQLVFIYKDKADQSTCGWIGFYNNVAALLGALIVGRFADYFTGKMKLILIFLLVSASVSYSWVILLINDYISYNLASLYVSSTLFGLFLAATTPLFFEITVEGAFPVGEESTLFTMLSISSIFSLLFLLPPMIPSLGRNFSWLNWVVLGTTAVCIPIMAFYKEQYNRLDIDTNQVDTNQVDEDNNKNTNISECDA